MLRIDMVQTIEGVTVFGDDRLRHVFYLLPEQPRFRIDDTTREPVFKFLKYRMPIERSDGKRGGGYCFFDVEFVVPEDKEAKIRQELQTQVNRHYQRIRAQPPTVQLGTITYTDGEAGLLLQADGGTLIERVANPGKPSLFGKNITPFALELSPEGATLFETALQGRGGVVQVVYDLKFMAALPPVNIHGRFRSEAFYSFYQRVDIDWKLWRQNDYRETIRETFRNSDSMDLNIDFGGLTDDKIKKDLRDWAFRMLEDAAERRMLEQIPAALEEERHDHDGKRRITRDISTTKIASFDLRFRERQPVEWNVAPQGTLPNITNLKGADGNPINPADYFHEVDLDDPFFQQLNVAIRVNADFETLPIHSVTAQLEYDEGRSTVAREFAFTSPDDVAHFAAYVENNVWDFNYSFMVNYRGQQRRFESERFVTRGNEVVINVGDLGVLDVLVVAGDIDFEQVRQAQVTLRYEGEGVTPIEQQFTLSQDRPEHRFQHVIFQTADRPYKWKARYFMRDGKRFDVDWQESRLPELPINDPFGAVKQVAIRTAGDMENLIQTIFLDLEYEDAGNDYAQSHSVALSRDNPFVDWSIPVVDPSAGVVRYSGSITYRDGTVEEIPLTETRAATIMVGRIVAGFLEVEVIPALIDWGEMRLAQVRLRHTDPDTGAEARRDLVFSPTNDMPATWTVELTNGSAHQYRWQAVYFRTDGTRIETAWEDTDQPSLILDPANPA